MKIVALEPVRGQHPDSSMIAKFSVEITPEVKLCGLRLMDTPHGLRIHYPSLSGGGRAVTMSPAVAEEIATAAYAALKGRTIASNSAA